MGQMLKAIHHEEHEGHEEWNSMSWQIEQLAVRLKCTGVRIIGVDL